MNHLKDFRILNEQQLFKQNDLLLNKDNIEIHIDQQIYMKIQFRKKYNSQNEETCQYPLLLFIDINYCLIIYDNSESYILDYFRYDQTINTKIIPIGNLYNNGIYSKYFYSLRQDQEFSITTRRLQELKNKFVRHDIDDIVNNMKLQRLIFNPLLVQNLIVQKQIGQLKCQINKINIAVKRLNNIFEK